MVCIHFFSNIYLLKSNLWINSFKEIRNRAACEILKCPQSCSFTGITTEILWWIAGTMALGWVAVCLFLIVNKPEDVGIEGADTVANASKEKDKGKHIYNCLSNKVWLNC